MWKTEDLQDWKTGVTVDILWKGEEAMVLSLKSETIGNKKTKK